MLVRFIGDVHGQFDHYKAISTADHLNCSIQVGDFGIGFVTPPEMDPNKEFFIRGNHDNPFLCKEHMNWLGDGHTWITKKNKIMFIGGAKSVDQDVRTMGVDWWPEEELSYADWEIMLKLYEEYKPDIMVTHDAPKSVIPQIFPYVRTHWLAELRYKSLTQAGLDELFQIHKPKMWFFGHHHDSQVKVVDGTIFRCLGILDYVDVEL